MADEPDVVTDYATLLKAQVQYKVRVDYTQSPQYVPVATLS
jgi:hypothetical protein